MIFFNNTIWRNFHAHKTRRNCQNVVGYFLFSLAYLKKTFRRFMKSLERLKFVFESVFFFEILGFEIKYFVWKGSSEMAALQNWRYSFDFCRKNSWRSLSITVSNCAHNFAKFEATLSKIRKKTSIAKTTFR